MDRPPRVLSIAGSDPSGGAGIQADLKTFHAFGVYGMAVVTALTAQNTRGVTGIHDVPAGFVAAQIRAVFDDIGVSAVKTGMLKTPAIIGAVADVLGESETGHLVVDPVMVATSGDRLIDEEAVETLKVRLLPLADLATPNREEAAVLADREVSDLSQGRAAADSILAFGAKAVLVKGIREGDEMIDLLVTATGSRDFRLPLQDSGATHGTGCTLSSALASLLALGAELEEAVTRAKRFVWRAMERAFPVGGGSLPLNHLVSPEDRPA